jgi:hypothetical protein
MGESGDTSILITNNYTLCWYIHLKFQVEIHVDCYNYLDLPFHLSRMIYILVFHKNIILIYYYICMINVISVLIESQM